MTRDQRHLASLLLRWYEKNRRDLPWRRDPTPYAVWISEIMLQQTQVETVIPYYQRFLSRFPTLESLAQASLDEVLPLWSGLGYYRRARHLHSASREILASHEGRFPADLKAALALPGIGPYTAGAILSIAYNLPVPVLDGNVERVLTRVRALPGDPRRSANRSRLWKEAEAWIPANRAGELNQALMELGALICLPLQPRCGKCPLARSCEAHLLGQEERFPEKKPARKPIPVDLAVLVVERNGEFLLVHTAADGEGDGISGNDGSPSYLRGLWNFPAVETRGSEKSAVRLAASLRRRWGVSASPPRKIGTARHAITFRKITLHAWIAQAKTAPSIQAGPGAAPAWRWARPEDLGTKLAVPSLAFKVLKLAQAKDPRMGTGVG